MPWYVWLLIAVSSIETLFIAVMWFLTGMWAKAWKDG